MLLFQVVRSSCRFAVIIGAFCAVLNASGQAPLPIYTDNLVNGFQDWGWATHNYANTSPVHSGNNSVSVTIATQYEGLQIYHPDFDSTPYDNLNFWIHGGTSGGQKLQVYGLLHIGSTPNAGQQIYFSLGTLQTNSWQQFTIPLSALGVANKSNFTGFVIQDRIGAAQPTFFVDDIQINTKPAPALVQVSLNTTQAVRTADARWFGVNTAVWDSNFDTSQTVSLLNEMGTRIMRFSGGSLSDEYHWASNKTLSNTWTWATSFANFVHVTTNVGAQAFITVNYGTGTPAEAAAWVRHANVTNHYGFKYWEIGNECHGSWETDSNTFPHDPYTYAVRATNYVAQMRAADPTIRIGVVAATGENSYSNLYSLNHPAVNPRTGQTNYGWTPIMLAALKNLGVTPDYIIHHVYPEYTGQENDPVLLQSATSWPNDAADLRQQITDYFGPAGTNIELVCTENNSNSGSQGKQSTSLVNGLYYADSLGQLMKTEINAFVWWDLRNGTDTTGSFSPLLYGWRTYGDLGMINGPTNRHPTFYAAKLMKSFARSGDTILNATSDYYLLSAYAARLASGAVTLLVLNKDTVTNFSAQIVLNGFIPTSVATVRSYGVPQDEATRTNATYSGQDIATNGFASVGTNFTYNFPRLSLTLLTLTPTAPSLAVLSSVQPTQFLFQLQGQPSVRYVIQTSTNLKAWSSISTNTLSGSTLNVTNTVSSSAPVKFWRAVWLP
jgi:alpha-N-arabinofuranosidase